MTSFRLDGRVALVTGAGQGLGASISIAYAKAGASVVLLGRTESYLKDTADAIRKAGGEASLIVCDVTNDEKLRKAVSGLDRLDILVNNAGTNFPEPFIEVSDNHLDAMLDLNVRACFVAAQAAVQVMLKSADLAEHGASVVNMSSQMGHVGSPNRTVYCMTKHAVEGLTKAMAVELADKNIRVNSIGPTFSETPMVQRIVDTPEKKEFVTSRIPMGRLAKLEDVAAAAVYLASPAASMVTGTHLIVDGGWTAQ
ncbi:MAG: glucose 1-dehydrogenase [Burkholderiales bacterium]|nr:glucose 1-dehydrogenase [Burkholderiales bacterium]MBT5950199.1 glucose 1-dehydrogenase [Betaproteobacteria bacterium]MCH1423822.1 glucose 1-dehydrogenase [Burkholderiales bacterium]